MVTKQGNTLVNQTVLVKKVLRKADSKFGKAAIVVPFNGKDEFLGLNDTVDENAFIEGNSYEVGISVSKTGKRYVQEIIKDLGVLAGDDKVLATVKASSATATNGSTSHRYVDNSVGQRQGALGHYASRLVAAFINVGKVENEQQAVELFNKLNNELNETFGK